MSQEELRSLLGLPAAARGLGISIERDRFCLEFAGDGVTLVLTARQLQRRLTKQVTTK